MRTRVYIAAPISLGNRGENFDQAAAAQAALIRGGMAPLNPVLTMCHPQEAAIEHDDWLETDFPWVSVAEVVLRLPGQSRGADAEVAMATKLGIPIFYSVQELLQAHEDGQFARREHALPTDDQIKAERQQVYGDPLENHRGIAAMWTPLLQPHADKIAAGIPLPPHIVALCMVLLKIDRMRLAFHEDNYADARNYLAFAERWQGDQEE